LIFEFDTNDYFTNTKLEKIYYVSKDLLIEKIESTPIEWKEGKNLCVKKVTKTLKNKSMFFLKKILNNFH
jgi:nucleosome assembly protein 1-like 1